MNGTQGPQGIQGSPGANEINATNLYTITGNTSSGVALGIGLNITSIAICDTGDFVQGGGFETTGPASVTASKPLVTENGWNATAYVFPPEPPASPIGSVTANAVCFDNPPLRP